MTMEVESAEYVYSHCGRLVCSHLPDLMFCCSVVKLIAQFLKEHSLLNTLQVLQVSNTVALCRILCECAAY